jgi:hypothetical protein
MFTISATKVMKRLLAGGLKAMCVDCLFMDVRYLYGDVRALESV